MELKGLDMLKKILLISSLLVAQDSDVFIVKELGSKTFLFGTESTIIIDHHDPLTSIVEITILGESDGIQSGYYNGFTFENNGQVWEDITERDEQSNARPVESFENFGGLRNTTRSPFLDMLRRRLRQDKPSGDPKKSLR